ncbi:TIR domain-containing protein [Exercitatus varius]|uniref:TIR domain-containing protein n=1 Tax=Exercitatus varius TaxID=67857 RepID=UPI00294B04A6|nr:TIR domain-containing protein [Exercitatus varius]MDG2942084.1 TIR domain-containing protein [Exercitatus varius]
MPVNIFISYSHKDENFKDDLCEHMSSLKRDEVVSEWNDRKILPGQDWGKQISENLENADIILFLISSSFLASDYCVDIEVKRAMEKHQNQEAVLIPIIVRDVDWGSSKLANFQALPKDAKAVDSWDKRDAAWVSVIKGLRATISEFKKKEITKIEQDSTKMMLVAKSNNLLNSAHERWLNDTAVELTHRKKDSVFLDDVYIVPDVEYEKQSYKDKRLFTSATSILSKNKVILYGDEQQGKTSFLKYFFKEKLENEYPIYLMGKDIKNSDVEKILDKAISNQYSDLSLDVFKSSSKKKVILIDDIDTINLNETFFNKFINNLESIFDQLIFTANFSFSLLLPNYSSLSEFELVKLLNLGNKKREELIKQWLKLGTEETIKEEDLYAQCDDIQESLNLVLRKNIVPAKPIYILTFIQMFDTQKSSNYELSSYGHCYQYLIYQALNNAKINPKEFDKYLNFLTELSWYIFKAKQGLGTDELSDFFDSYSESYILDDKEKVINNLISHSILVNLENRINFKYPYIFYFFIAKKIAEGYLDSDSCREEFNILLNQIHKEDSANILIFITHHTRNYWILDEIKSLLLRSFKDRNVASLDKEQLSFMQDFMNTIPDLIIEQREIQRERDRHNEKLDKMQINDNSSLEDKIDQSKILTNINRTFKAIEISGQIIKNRYASLKKEQLIDLARGGIESGLRFLDYFISLTDMSKNEIIKVIETNLAENPKLSNNQIKEFAEKAYLHMTYFVINGLLRKISSSIGSKDARQIYQLIEERKPTPAIMLIRQSIDIHFTKKIDIKSLALINEKLKDNPVCLRILKEIVLQHIYMFPVKYQEKQQLSELLGISLKGQQFAEYQTRKISG